MPWVKGTNQVTRAIVNNLNNLAFEDVKKTKIFAESKMDLAFQLFQVYDTGLSFEKSFVKMRQLKRSIRIKFGVSLDKVPYAPFWYNGWGTNKRYGRRPVYEVAAETYAQNVLKLGTPKVKSQSFLTYTR